MRLGQKRPQLALVGPTLGTLTLKHTHIHITQDALPCSPTHPLSKSCSFPHPAKKLLLPLYVHRNYQAPCPNLFLLEPEPRTFLVELHRAFIVQKYLCRQTCREKIGRKETWGRANQKKQRGAKAAGSPSLIAKRKRTRKDTGVDDHWRIEHFMSQTGIRLQLDPKSEGTVWSNSRLKHNSAQALSSGLGCIFVRLGPMLASFSILVYGISKKMFCPPLIS